MDKYLKLAVMIVWLAAFPFEFPGTLPIVKSASAYELNRSKILWNHLSFKGKSIFGKVNTEVFLTDLPAVESGKMLLTLPESKVLQNPKTRVISITVQSTVVPLIGSKHYLKNQVWMIPKTATALQRVRLRRGSDTWQKIYRFSDRGVYRLRRKPMDDNEKKMTPEKWTRVKSAFYEYNSKDLDCPVVLEANGLFYLVSSLDFKHQLSPFSLCVFNKKQLHQVNVSPNGYRRMQVNYLEKSGDNQTQRKRDIDALKISFKSRALVSEDERPETFSFMGLKGDFEIFIDAATRIPVLVIGKIKGPGKVSITLHEVGLVQ